MLSVLCLVSPTIIEICQSEARCFIIRINCYANTNQRNEVTKIGGLFAPRSSELGIN